jgi:pimeloyl-ACP methyl ester carboxylesterase
MLPESVDVDGHRLRYRVSGQGPALVVLDLYRGRDAVHARVLGDRWRVFQVHPLGYGDSDRVPGHTGEGLAGQVLRVLDKHDVDRFVVWGYSKGGAMALCVARQSERAAGFVCGGFAPQVITSAVLQRLDRRLRPDHPSRSLWWWFRQVDWDAELRAMSCAQLFYWGADDRRMAPPLRALDAPRAALVELPGLDHAACNEPDALEHVVVPTVAERLATRI